MKRLIKDILLNEGRKEDVWSKYIDKAQDGPIKDRLISSYELFVDGDPSGNHKYLSWMMKKMLDMLIERGVDYPDYHENGVLNLVQEFHKNSQRLQKKDINQYKTVKELDDVIRKLPKSKKEEKLEGIDKIYEDDNILVVLPKTHGGSCTYGANTQWCVTTRDDDSNFRSYSNRGTLYFIIWKPKMPEKLKHYQKIARFVQNGMFYEFEGEYYDSRDNRKSVHYIESDLFVKREVYDNQLGYSIVRVPDANKPYYETWNKAKIAIDTHYAKNGMTKPTSSDWEDDDDWEDGDDWEDDGGFYI